jgi:hypothetical protein
MQGVTHGNATISDDNLIAQRIAIAQRLFIFRLAIAPDFIPLIFIP